MSDLRVAARQALEALEQTHTQPGCEQWQAERRASVALRASLAQPEQEQPEQCMAHGECFGGQCIYTSQSGQPEQDTDCHAQGICQRSGYSIGQPEQEPDRWGAGYEAGYAAGMAEMKQEPVAWLDAERYRWLRTAGAWESEIGLEILSKEPYKFDAAVDAARNKT